MIENTVTDMLRKRGKHPSAEYRDEDLAVPAPEPVRGRRNEPANVRFVAEKLAEIRGEPLEELAVYTFENAMKTYGIEG